MFQARGSTAKWASKKGWVYLPRVDTIMKNMLLEAIGELGIHLRAAAEAHPHLCLCLDNEMAETLF